MNNALLNVIVMIGVSAVVSFKLICIIGYLSSGGKRFKFMHYILSKSNQPPIEFEPIPLKYFLFPWTIKNDK